MRRHSMTIGAAILCLLAVDAAFSVAGAETPMRVAGNFSANRNHVEDVERPFFDGLAKNSGVNIRMNSNPMDVVGVQAQDALCLIRSGAFDVMSVQIG
jgi:hypothetical protein